MSSIYPLQAVRALVLHAQGLTTPNGAEPPVTLESLYQTAERLGCVQLDTLQMVQRSHYLVPWSRLGNYNPADFDQLAYNPIHRRLFEGWQHAACIIPLSEYRYQMPHQRFLREHPSRMSEKWLSQPDNASLIQHIKERIHKEGGVRSADFKQQGTRRGSWWDWKPAKNALEHLYAWGDLMISNRVNFQRVYDLTERVLPNWVDREAPTAEERDRFWIERGARALGICTPSQAGNYTWMKFSRSKPIIETLLQDGILLEVQAETADGSQRTLIIHRDNLEALEKASAGEIQALRTTFLSPFDSLFWAQGRDRQVWGFKQALEAYKPKPQRIWGYFCMPILHQARLVGRFDPKLERKTHTLRLIAIYLEPGIQPDEKLVSDTVKAMRDFLAFHHAVDLVIERSQPKEFGVKLLAAI